ncbi:SDR family NAD(P)-dependent oxidoreductase [Arthrobacter glacialis]|uniref:SDR family NAD(P)-dependent oxidoreductase n=1 Tax=Arthrobacter glacialis TaxID=1664 RepID=UPI000CD3DF08|nr:SDR family oxidoreductase [Arthrobacter glacialis]POH60137.1 short-chain dehydrogenase [Arthrobacter glacialis]
MTALTFALNAPAVVVVTGAGRGIGRETARLLAESGSTVIAVDLLQEVLAAPSEESSPRWHGLNEDITDACFAETLTGVVAASVAGADPVERAGAVSLGLVNCAFTEQRATILAGTKEGWQRTMDVNFHAAVELSRALAALAIVGGHPASIVNVTSVHANLAHADFAAYSASKAALTAFTRSASEEWGSHGIRVNAVAPGFVAVERNHAVWSDPHLAASLQACNNLGRLAGSAEIAAGVIFLLSPAASFITGVVLPIDGGQTSRLLEVQRS